MLASLCLLIKADGYYKAANFKDTRVRSSGMFRSRLTPGYRVRPRQISTNKQIYAAHSSIIFNPCYYWCCCGNGSTYGMRESWLSDWCCYSRLKWSDGEQRFRGSSLNVSNLISNYLIGRELKLRYYLVIVWSTLTRVRIVVRLVFVHCVCNVRELIPITVFYLAMVLLNFTRTLSTREL